MTAKVESSAEDVIKVLIDDDDTGKKIAVRPLDPQTHRRKDVWPAIFQVDIMQTSPSAFLHKHEDDVLSYVRAKNYKYSSESMSVVSLACGKLGAVSFEIMPEHHRGKKRFLKDRFSLAAAHGLHRSLCAHQLATFRKLGTQCASQLIS